MLKKLSCLLLTAALLVASLSIPARAEGKWVALGTGDVAEVRFESLENEKYPNFKFRCRVRLKEDKSDMPLCCTVPLGDLIEDYISANPSQKGRKVDASKIKVDISTVQEASTVYKMTMEFSIGTVSTTIDTRIDLARFFPDSGFVNYEAYYASKCTGAILNKFGNPSDYSIGEVLVDKKKGGILFRIPLTIRNEYNMLYGYYKDNKTFRAKWGNVEVPQNLMKCDPETYAMFCKEATRDPYAWSVFPIAGEVVMRYLK